MISIAILLLLLTMWFEKWLIPCMRICRIAKELYQKAKEQEKR